MTERKWGKYNGDMPTEVDFLRAVIARPDDDAPRLVYADWLDEQGQGDHAKFIRVQCALAALDAARKADPKRHARPRGLDCWCEDCGRAEVLNRRERELYCFENTSRWAHFPDFFAEFQWRRGFVEAVTCPAADWLAHADVILAAQPVREVTLTTWPETWGPYNTRPTAEEWLHSRWPSVKTWHLPPAEHAPDIQHLANLIDGRR